MPDHQRNSHNESAPPGSDATKRAAEEQERVFLCALEEAIYRSGNAAGSRPTNQAYDAPAAPEELRSDNPDATGKPAQ